MRVYSGLGRIPDGHADVDALCEGCLVLEGGAFRGLYTQGALDAFMEEGINIRAVIGVSAGAMSGMDYVSGQIGRSARINLHYRHNPDYIGLGAMRRDHGITGFRFIFDEYEKLEPLDRRAFDDPRRRFVAVATDVETGEAAYLENGVCGDIFRAIQASASVPYISQPVELDGRRYLDGGCAVHIPVDWAIAEGYEKILVIRTRDRAYRKEADSPAPLIDVEYGRYPAFARKLKGGREAYNSLVAHIDELERAGRIFVLAPQRPVEIARFERDMEKLGALYWQGYVEALEAVPEVKEYLGII